MFHHRHAFDEVSRAMRAPLVPADRGRNAAVPELIEALDRLFASTAATPPRPGGGARVPPAYCPRDSDVTRGQPI